MDAPTPGAVDEFRPLLYPFVASKTSISRNALRGLIDKMVKVIFTEVSAACANNPLSLTPLTDFISSLSAEYITRILRQTTTISSFKPPRTCTWLRESAQPGSQTVPDQSLLGGPRPAFRILSARLGAYGVCPSRRALRYR
jgi:hypothetical protein